MGRSNKSKRFENFAYISQYGDNLFKVTVMHSVLASGYENNKVSHYKRTDSSEIKEERLRNNISRAKSRVKELALCNDWTHFCTFTLNKDKQCRTDLKLFHSQFAQYIRDFRKKGIDIKYLMIPEYHADGKSVHIHALMMFPDGVLTPFVNHRNLPKYIRRSIAMGKNPQYWKFYSERFGYNVCEPIQSIEKTASYVCKYMTKDLASRTMGKGQHMFYASKGLNSAKRILCGDSLFSASEDDAFYHAEYCDVLWCDYETAVHYAKMINDGWEVTKNRDSVCDWKKVKQDDDWQCSFRKDGDNPFLDLGIQHTYQMVFQLLMDCENKDSIL